MDNLRIREDDWEAMRSIFKDNEPLVKLLRKIFYHQTLSSEDTKSLQASLKGKNSTLPVFEKLFQPRLTTDEPLGNAGSRWIDRKFGDYLAQEMRPFILGRQKSINWVQKGLDRIEDIMDGGKGKTAEHEVDLDFTRDYEELSAEDIKMEIVAMQDHTAHIELCLSTLNVMVNIEKPTTEEAKKIMAKNSSK